MPAANGSEGACRGRSSARDGAQTPRGEGAILVGASAPETRAGTCGLERRGRKGERAHYRIRKQVFGRWRRSSVVGCLPKSLSFLAPSKQ